MRQTASLIGDVTDSAVCLAKCSIAQVKYTFSWLNPVLFQAVIAEYFLRKKQALALSNKQKMTT